MFDDDNGKNSLLVLSMIESNTHNQLQLKFTTRHG